MTVTLDFEEGMGNVAEWLKQEENNKSLHLPQNHPVYIAWKPQKHLDKIREILSFVSRFEVVTVRHCYYHLVSSHSLSETKDGRIARKQYELTVRLVSNMRYAGMLGFESIIDDTRWPERTFNWSSMSAALEFARGYFRSKWSADQPKHVEVWLEKRTLRHLFLPITDSFNVYLCIGGGYESGRMIYDCAQRLKEAQRIGQEIIVLYFGDLDPSGKDMPVDIENRLRILGVCQKGKIVEEVALMPEDIKLYDLPRNPTKTKDMRNKGYMKKYGIDYAVELDVLGPGTLETKIREAILRNVDSMLLDKHREEDAIEKAEIKEALDELWRKRRERKGMEPEYR